MTSAAQVNTWTVRKSYQSNLFRKDYQFSIKTNTFSVDFFKVWYRRLQLLLRAYIFK